jgi:hypothetical protein
MEDTNDQVDIPEVPDLPEVEEGAEDTTDWKALAQERQGQLKEARGIAKRYQTKYQKALEPKPESSKPAPQDKKGFDYAEKAYLKSSGIEAADFDLVKEVMDSTSKDIDSVLASKFFQAELKERKDLRMTEAATPSGSKRAGNTTRDQVDYWIAKGELPPVDQVDLRRAVVNARMKAETNKSTFTDSPVVNGRM